ncbi:hypothetical protein [Acinetobacter chinensis]|nr:hypothetical protein [Acinetobacter chinensis]
MDDQHTCSHSNKQYQAFNRVLIQFINKQAYCITDVVETVWGNFYQDYSTNKEYC